MKNERVILVALVRYLLRMDPYKGLHQSSKKTLRWEKKEQSVKPAPKLKSTKFVICIVNNSEHDLYIELFYNDLRPSMRITNAIGPWRAKKNEAQQVWVGDRTSFHNNDDRINIYLYSTNKPGMPAFWKEDVLPMRVPLEDTYNVVVDQDYYKFVVKQVQGLYVPSKEAPKWVNMLLFCIVAALFFSYIGYMLWKRWRQGQGGESDTESSVAPLEL